MTNITIMPENAETDSITYCAIAGERQSTGATVGKALDALLPQLSEDESSTLIIVQNRRPDAFFSAGQQQRLEDLMAQWRAARDAGRTLPPADQAELEALVEAETRSAGERAAALLLEMNQ